MAPDTKIGRSSAPDVGSSTVWGSWGAEADELLEPLEAEVSEDISNKSPKDPGEIRRDKERKVCGGPNRRNAAEEKWRRKGT